MTSCRRYPVIGSAPWFQELDSMVQIHCAHTRLETFNNRAVSLWVMKCQRGLSEVLATKVSSAVIHSDCTDGILTI